MRVKSNTDMSFTISEIPQNDESKLERDFPDMDMSPSPTRLPSPVEEHVKYEKKMFARPKSSIAAGRTSFNGRIHCLAEFDKQKSARKGQKMHKITNTIMDTSEKIKLMQSRINTLKRQEDKSKKRVGKMTKTHSVITSNKSTFDVVRVQRTEIQEKKRIEQELIKERILEQKKQNQESRHKMRHEVYMKQQAIQEAAKKEQNERREQLLLKEQKMFEQKKQITAKQKKDRQNNLERRKSAEREFIEHINYQYHIDRKQKIELMKEQELILKQLEEKESHALDSLHKTISQEQSKAMQLRTSLENINNWNSRGGKKLGGSKSQIDILDIYQTPRPAKYVDLTSSRYSSRSKTPMKDHSQTNPREAKYSQDITPTKVSQLKKDVAKHMAKSSKHQSMASPTKDSPIPYKGQITIDFNKAMKKSTKLNASELKPIKEAIKQIDKVRTEKHSTSKKQDVSIVQGSKHQDEANNSFSYKTPVAHEKVKDTQSVNEQHSNSPSKR